MNDQGTHIDLFSGIGGFALAARWTGFRTVVFCERDEFCQRVLRKHWPEVPCVPDIHDFDGRQFAGATLLTGGFPCQPYSKAGKQQGRDDERYLWPQMLRIIAESKPQWILGENVPPLVHMGLDEVCADLEENSYTVWPAIVPACAVGAPHKRERLWVVAHSNRGGCDQNRKGVCMGRLPNQQKNVSGEVAASGCIHGRAQWEVEPQVGRVAYGISPRMDGLRMKALGNAIVPQVAAEVMRMICIANAPLERSARSDDTLRGVVRR